MKEFLIKKSLLFWFYYHFFEVFLRFLFWHADLDLFWLFSHRHHLLLFLLLLAFYLRYYLFRDTGFHFAFFDVSRINCIIFSIRFNLNRWEFWSIDLFHLYELRGPLFLLFLFLFVVGFRVWVFRSAGHQIFEKHHFLLASTNHLSYILELKQLFKFVLEGIIILKIVTVIALVFSFFLVPTELKDAAEDSEDDNADKV